MTHSGFQSKGAAPPKSVRRDRWVGWLVHALVLGVVRWPSEASDLWRVQFANGDRLTVASIRCDASSERILTAGGPVLQEPVSWEPGAIVRVTRTPPPALAPGPMWHVLLQRNQALEGDEVLLDGDTMRIRHRGLGEIVVSRDVVVALVPRFDRWLTYEGPREGDEWTVGGSPVRLDRPILTVRSDAPAAREFKDLPVRFEVEVEAVEWSMMSNLVIYLLAQGSPRRLQELPAGYMLQVHGHGYATLLRRTPNMVENIGQAQIGRMRAGTLRVQVFVDTEKDRFILFCNGQLIGDWRDPRRLEPRGQVIGFQSHAAINLRRVVVTRWDGALPGRPQSEQPRAADMLLLANDDTISGTVRRIGPEGVLLQSRFGELNIPLDRLERIDLRTAAPREWPEGLTTIRWGGNGRLDVQVRDMDDAGIRADHPWIGAMTVPWALVSRIDWRTDPAEDGQESEP